MDYLEECIREYGDAVYRFCCNQTRNRYEAEELYQDTFLCVMENQKKFKKVKNPKCYILGVALNLERNRRRKRARRNQIMPVVSQQVHTVDGEQADALEFADPSGRGTVQEVICLELQQSMQDAVAALPERYRDILSLFYGNELTIAEIAQVLKV